MKKVNERDIQNGPSSIVLKDVTLDGILAIPIGYFGASTGGGAAIVAASRQPETIRAVVSRGGRPDFATENVIRD